MIIFLEDQRMPTYWISLKRYLIWTSCLIMFIGSMVARAGGSILQSIDFASLPGDNLQIVLTLDGPAQTPRAFHTENPARIAIDLSGVTSGLEKKSIPINMGGAQSVQAVEAGGRTRVVINLSDMRSYTTSVSGNRVVVLLQGGGAQSVSSNEAGSLPKPAFRLTESPSYSPNESVGYRRVEHVDFRRGEKGEGRVILTLSDPKTLVEIKEQGQKIVARLADTELPLQWAKRLDVVDFATPVQTIEVGTDGSDVRLNIIPLSSEYDYSSYQSGKLLTIELRPLTRVQKEEIKKKTFTYTGDKLTLNFQDIPVRSVLQILADFTNLNIVASDTVKGNVTLRLEDVPWDQALDLVLKSRGLGKRQDGNVVRVAPLKEILEQEKSELQAVKEIEEVEPLHTEIIQINYTTAEAIETVLKNAAKSASTGKDSDETDLASTTAATSGVDVTQTVLSKRGNVTSDPRTNQVIVRDTAKNIEQVRSLIRQLDKPIRQVLIESRIVIATNDFTRELGSRLSLNRPNYVQQKRGAGNDKKFEQVTIDPVTGQPKVDNWALTSNTDTMTAGDALVDLAAVSAAASGGYFGVTFLKVGEYLLDLELSAAQVDNRAEIVSTPKVVTMDQTKASIVQGEQIPYQTTVIAGGAATPSIVFKKAFLELNVTPHITPDDQVSMQIHIRKNSRGADTIRGPAIDTREVETTALVFNGETIVLGGVFEGTQNNVTDKVPFLGDLPGIGFMFRRDKMGDNKRELLVFVTPKILAQNLTVR